MEKEIKYYTPEEWLRDYAMGGSYHPEEVSEEVKQFAKKHNWDIPSMKKALKSPILNLVLKWKKELSRVSLGFYTINQEAETHMLEQKIKELEELL